MKNERANLAELPAGIVLFKPVPDLLARLLDCIATEQRQIFAFCNGAPDDAIEALLATYPNVLTIRSPANVGLGAGLNEVIRHARSAGYRYIQFFDQDSSPDVGVALRLFERMQRDDGKPFPIAVVAPHLVPPEKELYLQIRYEEHSAARHLVDGAVKFTPTSGSLISMAAVDRIGMFRDDFFIDGIDVEWCLRAWHNGFACIVAREIDMTHRWGKRQSGERKAGLQILLQDPLRNFYYIRNTLHCVFLNHFSFRQKMALLVRLAAQSTVLLARNWHNKRTWSIVFRALKAGLLGPMGQAPRDL